MKTRLVRLLALVGLVALGACGNDEAKRIDQLRKDLALAGAYPYQPYVTPLEQGYGNATRYQPQPNANGGYTPVSARSTPIARREPVYASTTTRAPVATRVVKNTKRDAIIGAAAGAAIGAVITRDVKGAVIGAAAGGILGAVIGNNVDKKRVPIP
jgi:uncharacterized protein YcfJ